MTRRTFFRRVAREDHFDELAHKAVNFEKAWDPFVRKLFGCEARGETTAETCLVSRREVDLANYTKARKAAMKLFDLAEPRDA